MNRSALASTIVIAALLASSAQAQFWFDHLMISEVSWGDPDGLEITNFASTPRSLANVIVKWHDGNGTVTTPAIGGTIQPGQSIIVCEGGFAIPEAPASTVIRTILPSVPTTTSEITVALVEGASVLDEVWVSDINGTHTGFTFGGFFYGVARRSNATPINGAVGVERIWGLDSDGGLDWTEQASRSFGLENRSSGPLGTDPYDVATLRFNEVNGSPRYVEIQNVGTAAIDLGGMYVLVSDGQNTPLNRVGPLPTQSIPAGGFVVLGNGASAPSEKPAGVPYLNIGALGGGLGTGNGPLTMVLYDWYGRVADAVHTTAFGTEQVHNFPRPPAHWSAFTGATGSWGSLAIARVPGSDTHSGTDWNPAIRSMGLANATFLSTAMGFGERIDVRLSEGGGDGSTMIMCAGAPAAGWSYYFFFTLGHASGTGIFLGLGPDALSNWPLLNGIAPFSGTLDSQGSARWDFGPGSFPPGFAADFIFYAASGSGLVRTKVIAFDT